MASVPPKGGRKHPQQEFLQVDTSNILFLCGGAFCDLETIIERRIGKSLGFRAELKTVTRPIEEHPQNVRDGPHQVRPHPEFVGASGGGTLHELGRDALIRIMSEPRNAIIRQYQRLFEYENVKLRFTDDAMKAIADQAVERKIGARGLRMIIEDLMLELMYTLPSQKKVKEVVVTKEVVEDREKPVTLIEKAG
jgi:ATP-dependent Clp protease ATP-binding subunit ClpX